MKQCRDCNKNETDVKFTKCKGEKRNRCDICYRIYLNKFQKTYRDKNKTKIQQSAKAYRQATKEHRNQYARFWKYGISKEEYDRILEAQDGCAICKRRSDTNKLLAVDHDHTCCPGKRSCGNCIRGLLCSSCNTGLGFFRDNLDLLIRAIEYLEREGVKT